MPSVDPATGKPLSGAALRRRKRLQSSPPSAVITLEAPPPDDLNPFADFPAPPLESVQAVEVWGGDLGAAVLRAAERGEDPARVRWLAKNLRRLGQMLKAALRSEAGCLLLARYRDKEVELHGPTQPAEEVALVAWAYFRMARALHGGAVAPAPFDDEAAARWGLQADAAAAMASVPRIQRLKDLVGEIRDRPYVGDEG